MKIRYDRGTIIIHLEPFLETRNTAKVRKLVKLINGSMTPGCLGKMQEYVEHHLLPEEQFKADIKATADRAVYARAKEKEALGQPEKVLAMRTGYGKNTPMYLAANEKVKQYREEAGYHHSLYRAYSQDLNRMEKDRGFFIKVLEIIAQGR